MAKERVQININVSLVEHLRRKHRVMTIAEYASWCDGGDAISSASSANAFPGGLTIDFSSDPDSGRHYGVLGIVRD